MLNFIDKHPALFFVGFLVFMVILCIVLRISSHNSELAQISMGLFSIEFSKLVSESRTDTPGYNKCVEKKELVELKNHPDFIPFRNTRFLSGLMDGIEDIMIPADINYGICAVLSVNYDRIRGEITHPMFLSVALSNLLKINRMCDKKKLNTILEKHQRMVFAHRDISEYNYWDLPYILPFIKLYFLYLYFIENPESARSLNGRDFYNFKVPAKLYYRSGNLYFPIHRYYM